MFHATKGWLKDRLGLDISPEKSKIVNLKESYSEFLGFKMRVIKRGKKKKWATKVCCYTEVPKESNIQQHKDRYTRNNPKSV